MLDMIDDHTRTGERFAFRDHLLRPWLCTQNTSRRWNADWRIFQRIYRHLVDEWVVYDNLGAAPAIQALEINQ